MKLKIESYISNYFYRELLIYFKVNNSRGNFYYDFTFYYITFATWTNIEEWQKSFKIQTTYIMIYILHIILIVYPWILEYLLPFCSVYIKSLYQLIVSVYINLCQLSYQVIICSRRLMCTRIQETGYLILSGYYDKNM